jgi:hypothetical protein
LRKPSKAKKTGKEIPLKKGEGVEALRNFINGKRGAREAWADWDIPISWGRNADPFPPEEKELGYSLECLELLAETRYPFILTTKSILPTQEPYRSLFAKCNCVLQFSMVCDKYNRMENNAPPYAERLKAVEEMSKIVPRVIARWQPMFFEMIPFALPEIPKLAKAGAYGILVERAKLAVPKGDCNFDLGRLYTYPVEETERQYRRIRKQCHEHGLKFLTGDMMRLSDSLECCGTEGVKGFKPNLCTTARHFLAPETYAVTEGQKKPNTGKAWMNVYCSHADKTFQTDSFVDCQERLFTADSMEVFKFG